MDQQYLRILPAGLQHKVAQIEAAIKGPILVRKRRLGDVVMVGAEHLTTVDCYMNQGKMFVTILLPDGSIQPHTLAHEVIHAWRKIVMFVPLLQAEDSKVDRFLSDLIDNDVEHIFVIPLEIAGFPAARDYWNNLYSDLIEPISGAVRMQQRLKRSSANFRNELLRFWLVLSFVEGIDAMGLLETTLEQAGYLSCAKSMSDEALEVYPDKVRLLTVLLKYLEMPIDKYELAIFDVPNKAVRRVPFPSP